MVPILIYGGARVGDTLSTRGAWVRANRLGLSVYDANPVVGGSQDDARLIAVQAAQFGAAYLIDRELTKHNKKALRTVFRVVVGGLAVGAMVRNHNVGR